MWCGLFYNGESSAWEFTDGSTFVSFSDDDLTAEDGGAPTKCATFGAARLNDRRCRRPTRSSANSQVMSGITQLFTGTAFVWIVL